MHLHVKHVKLVSRMIMPKLFLLVPKLQCTKSLSYVVYNTFMRWSFGTNENSFGIIITLWIQNFKLVFTYKQVFFPCQSRRESFVTKREREFTNVMKMTLNQTNNYVKKSDNIFHKHIDKLNVTNSIELRNTND